jgi:streptomycin 6-kinase
MPEFELPANLVVGLATEDAASAQRTWIAGLPDLVGELAARWSLELGRPFQPGGLLSWVAPARTADGDLIVLKVGRRHDEALHEADGLRTWNGAGTVRLIDVVHLDQTDAMLLEACEPGTPLLTSLPPDGQDAVIAGMLRRLWIRPPADSPFRPLQSMCDQWAEEFELKYARAENRLDGGLARAGVELFHELSRPSASDALLCTDLHPRNVLAAEREPWLVIDPKPYVGDRTYDPLQHMLNFPDRLAADPRAFAERMADLLDLGRERLRQWLLARCVIDSVDQPYLRDVAVELSP